MEKLHVQPSELDMLPFYEFQFMVSIYNDILKERKDIEEKNTNTERDKYNIGDLKRQSQRQLGSFKQPSIPKINLPKM